LSRRGLAAVAVGAATLLSLAPAARAQQSALDAHGDITAPKVGDVETAAFHVVGDFHATGGFQRRIDSVTVKVVAKAPLPAWSHDYPACPPCPPTGSDPDSAHFDVTVAPPDHNGPYTATATAQVSDPSPVGGQPITRSTPAVDFFLSIKPGTPTGAKTSVKGRDVTVSWDRNGEPDMQFYDVSRQGPGQKSAQVIVRVLQPPPGQRPAFVDSTVPAPAGSYAYNITAIRPGATGDTKTSVAISDPTTVKATVPAGDPNSTTTPTQPPPKGTPAGPPVLKSTTGSIPRLSSASATTPTSEPVTPDPGFVRGLPYAGSNTTLPGEGEGGEAVALTPGGGRHKSNQKGLLVPAATGAILFVGAFQLRWLKKRLDEPVTTIN
jgi:hypothetical protein